MILIADSGSTKTDWSALSPNSKDTIKAQCEGLNPYFVDVEKVAKEAAGTIDKCYHDKVKVIYFYGSGCSTEQGKRIIKEGLQMVFPYARLFIEHDLLASARALCGREAGVACIIGTGANACYYDGERIAAEAVSFGYIMGDEGAGSYLGKLFIKALLNNRLHPNVEAAFYERYPAFDLEYLLHRLYRSSEPNRYLASFAPFIADYQQQESVELLIKKAFHDFVNEFVVDLKLDFNTCPIHFQGSIAWNFKKVLQDVLEERGMLCGRILAYPINALLEYHRQV